MTKKSNLENTYRKYFGDEWYEKLKDILYSDYFINLKKFIKEEKNNKIIYPLDISLSFRCFRETNYNDIKVVIIGQDIYHDNSFDGLAFSNANKRGISPSLRNIFLEIKRDCYDNKDVLFNKDLTNWAQQGVFLINVGLTVVKGKPGSHLDKWKPFMLDVIKKLNKKDNVVYLLWGRFAQKYKQFINPDNNCILEAGHPSPLNRTNPFKGCSHFSKTNKYLKENNINEIIWL